MKKRKEVFKFIITIVIIALLCMGLLFVVNKYKDRSEFGVRNIDLTGINKVMFVAHPDDDTIWGGGHLLEDDYLVVCVTCGSSQKRVLEFKSAMYMTKDKYLMLNYPDKTKGQRDNWEKFKPSIIEDVENILNLKDWELIVTHNPEGEYDHQHHKMVNEIITNLADKDKLTYFGKYYSKKTLEEENIIMPKLKEDLLERKLDVLEVYKTQEFIKKTFGHMFPYENWLTAYEWEKQSDE